MNCDECQKLILTDPYRLPETAKSHAAACQNCALHLARTIQLDEVLTDMVRERVAQGLKAKLLLNSRLKSIGRPHRWLALAASVLLASFLGFGYDHYAEPTTPQAWSDAMLGHIENNPQELTVGEPHSEAEQRRLLSSVGVGIKPGSAVKLLRSDLCKMKGTRAVHSIIDVGGTKAVVFFVPKILGVGSYSKNGWSTTLWTFDGRTVAVTARDAESLRRIVDALDKELIRKGS